MTMSEPTQVTLDKNKILAQLTSLSDMAKNGGWNLEYDSEVDQLFFGEETMPESSFLFRVNDEINLFLSPDSTVNGMFVEYFKVNYLEHNKDLQPVLKVLERDEADTSNAKVADIEKIALENELFLDALNSLFSRETLITAI